MTMTIENAVDCVIQMMTMTIGNAPDLVVIQMVTRAKTMPAIS